MKFIIEHNLSGTKKQIEYDEDNIVMKTIYLVEEFPQLEKFREYGYKLMKGNEFYEDAKILYNLYVKVLKYSIEIINTHSTQKYFLNIN